MRDAGLREVRDIVLPTVADVDRAASVIVAMSIMRDILRDAYLKPYYDPSKIPVQTQTSVLALFLGLFVCGVVVWVVMLWRYGMFDGKAAAAPESPAGGTQPE